MYNFIMTDYDRMRAFYTNLMIGSQYEKIIFDQPIQITPTNKLFEGKPVMWDYIVYNHDNVLKSYLISGSLDNFSQFSMCSLIDISDFDAISVLKLIGKLPTYQQYCNQVSDGSGALQIQ